jgi:hypothetical protein
MTSQSQASEHQGDKQMTNDQKANLNEPPPSADELRMAVLKGQMEEIERREKAQAAERKKLEKFTDEFLGSHVNDTELAMIRRLVANAVKDGAFEALVYTFPSDLCTDRGRAINNSEPHWPETLKGKAKELYDRFQANAKPKGFKLKAMIVNFPGGIPGDVGFFINWAPERN